MARSKAFIGIKRDVLLIVAALPPGTVTTFASIGEYLSVVPRHVAYILATLTSEEQRSVPWQRVVGEGGKLGKAKADKLGRSQEELLLGEGVGVAAGKVLGFSSRFVPASALEHGVEPHKHYLAE